MEKIVYTKAVKGGTVSLPPSKSAAHRALICAALSSGACTVHNIDNSRDMEATMSFIKALGRQFVYENRCVRFFENSNHDANSDLITVDCIESGSTLRFIIPIMAAFGIKTEFIGSGRLPNRPIGVYKEILKGVTTKGDGLPFYIEGKLEHGEFHLRGDISSQFVTGLLLALPLLSGDSKIILTSPLESEAYVDITLSVMESFGVSAKKTDYGYEVKGNQTYKSTDYTVEGDWSQAAFFIAMGAFCENEIRLKGLKPDSVQGDRACVDIFGKMGVIIERSGDDYIVKKPLSSLKSISVDVSQIPDMVPALAVVLALCDGQSEILGAKRLRIKESDRLNAVATVVNALGGEIKELEDGLVISGVKKLHGALVSSFNDHRIVMALSCLRAVSDGNIEVDDCMCVNKSYPSFYDEYRNLGGTCDVVDMG